MEERNLDRLSLSEARIYEILDLYEPDQVFLSHAEVIPGETKIEGTLLVPENSAYTRIEIPYVTAEQYIRCISQLTYVLLFTLQETGGLKIPDVTMEKLTLLKNRPAMFYRRFEELKFKQLTPKGEPFAISLTFEDARQVKDMAIGTFHISGPHVAGSFDGVAPIDIA